MASTGANEGVISLGIKSDIRPREREEAQTEDVCQSESRGNPLHVCHFCGTEFTGLCYLSLCTVSPLCMWLLFNVLFKWCLTKETFASALPNDTYSDCLSVVCVTPWRIAWLICLCQSNMGKIKALWGQRTHPLGPLLYQQHLGQYCSMNVYELKEKSSHSLSVQLLALYPMG